MNNTKSQDEPDVIAKKDSETNELVIQAVEDSTDELDNMDGSDLLEIPKGALVHIYEKLDELEEQLENVEEESAKKKSVEELEEEVSTMSEDLSSVDKEIDILHTRAESINNFARDLDSRVQSIDETVNDRLDDLEGRVTLMEEGKSETADSSEGSVESLASESHQLAHLSNLNNEDLEENFNVSVQRAVTIYKHFDSWSSRISAGRRLKSGELRKLLSAQSDKDELAWTQVHRAMKKFEEKTNSDFELVETKSLGKALIKRE